jgi:hypothetical protein
MTTRCYTCNAVIEDYKTGFALHRSTIEYIDSRHNVTWTNSAVQVICNKCANDIVNHPTRVPSIKKES